MADKQVAEAEPQGILEKIRKSGHGWIDLPNGDILVSYRDANRKTYCVVFSGKDGRTLAVGVQ